MPRGVLSSPGVHADREVVGRRFLRRDGPESRADSPSPDRECADNRAARCDCPGRWVGGAFLFRAKERAEILGRFLELPHGVPSSEALPPPAFHEALLRWARPLLSELEGQTIALDSPTTSRVVRPARGVSPNRFEITGRSRTSSTTVSTSRSEKTNVRFVASTARRTSRSSRGSLSKKHAGVPSTNKDKQSVRRKKKLARWSDSYFLTVLNARFPKIQDALALGTCERPGLIGQWTNRVSLAPPPALHVSPGPRSHCTSEPIANQLRLVLGSGKKGRRPRSNSQHFS